MPFALRDVRKLAFMSGSELIGPIYDVTSMYAFGGPIASLPSKDESVMHGRFQEAFAEYCLANRIVTQFTSYHPLLGNHRGLESTGLVEIRRRKQVAWIDLCNENRVRMLARNHRRSIARAKQLGVTTGPKKPTPQATAQFERLYSATMQRLGANERWFLPDSYLDNFIGCLGPDRITFFNTIAEPLAPVPRDRWRFDTKNQRGKPVRQNAIGVLPWNGRPAAQKGLCCGIVSSDCAEAPCIEP
jgi:hypothetical protein